MSVPLDLVAWFGPEAAPLARRMRLASAQIGDVVHELWPDELEFVRSAVPQRVREFARGRSLARELVRSFGGTCGAILRGSDRAPCWPADYVGSITHAGERCVVAVAQMSQLGALGIDLEPERTLERELWPEIATEQELAALAALSATEQARAVLRLFVAKEAVYKCLNARVGRFLEFHDVEIEPVEIEPVEIAHVEIEPFAATRFRVRYPSADVRAAALAAACTGFVGSREGWTLAVCALPCRS